jgi:predicted small lipoprotein YifL
MLVSGKLSFQDFLMRLFFIMLLSVYLLSACGLKKPLYLPQTDAANLASPGEIAKK